VEGRHVLAREVVLPLEVVLRHFKVAEGHLDGLVSE
jgi:hypothetical protein